MILDTAFALPRIHAIIECASVPNTYTYNSDVVYCHQQVVLMT